MCFLCMCLDAKKRRISAFPEFVPFCSHLSTGLQAEKGTSKTIDLRGGPRFPWCTAQISWVFSLVGTSGTCLAEVSGLQLVAQAGSQEHMVFFEGTPSSVVLKRGAKKEPKPSLSFWGGGGSVKKDTPT